MSKPSGLPYVGAGGARWPDVMNRKPSGPLLTGRELAARLYSNRKDDGMNDGHDERLEAMGEYLAQAGETIAEKRESGEDTSELEAEWAEAVASYRRLTDNDSPTPEMDIERDDDGAFIERLSTAIKEKLQPPVDPVKAALEAKDMSAYLKAKQAQAMTSAEETTQRLASRGLGEVKETLTHAQEVARSEQKQAARREAWLAEGRAALDKGPDSIAWRRFASDRPHLATEIQKQHRQKEAEERRRLDLYRQLGQDIPMPRLPDQQAF